MSTVKVIQNPDAPVEPEILAEAIVRISTAIQALSKSGLNREAIIVLVKDRTGLPKKTIDLVLNSLEQLKRHYCR